VSALELRPAVAAFAQLMERQLRANDHKGGWEYEHPNDLHSRLLEEAEELKVAIYNRQRTKKYERAESAECVGLEAADVANFAMMIADISGALDPDTTGGRRR
jgi:hypothetical protein